jgi:protease I
MFRLAGLTLLALAAAQPLAAQPPPIPISPDTELPGEPGRTVALFLAQQLFSNEEFETALRQLSRAGLFTRVSATDTGVAVGMSNVVVKPDLALADVRAADFAGLVLIGGSGAALHWDDSLLHARCREFAAAGRVVAAIGIAPITLARAGILKGRKATVFRDRTAIGWLKDHGAKFSFQELVCDRNVITAAGAPQAKAFGHAIAAAVLKGK